VIEVIKVDEEWWFGVLDNGNEGPTAFPLHLFSSPFQCSSFFYLVLDVPLLDSPSLVFSSFPLLSFHLSSLYLGYFPGNYVEKIGGW